MISPHPPSRGARHPPPPQGAVGIHTTGATNYYDSFHSWAVGIRPPRHFVPPLRRGELYSATGWSKFPSIGGVSHTPGPTKMQFSWVVGAGWLESTRLSSYSPLSSRAERGDPVNKKALRAFARRHIALDCHSRTPTFSTLIVLLRNDSGGVTGYS